MDKQSIEEKLKALKTPWGIEDASITYTFKFEDFLEAMRFVNQVAELAQKADHHPDIDIRYNKVSITLSTHDAGGVTQKDIDLAEQIDMLI
jgi:4a-hydroxytetrahydrobiopterin dehydratase